MKILIKLTANVSSLKAIACIFNLSYMFRHKLKHVVRILTLATRIFTGNKFTGRDVMFPLVAAVNVCNQSQSEYDFN